MNKDKANIPLLSDTTNSTATAATEMSGWNAGGLRLQLLHADCTNQPSLPCLFQDTVLHYFTMIQEYVILLFSFFFFAFLLSVSCILI